MTALNLWMDDLTPEIISIAKARVLKGGNLATRADLDRETVKLALILIRHLNPREEMTAEEEAILVGVTSKTLRAMKNAKVFVTVVNT